jgi:hypothetical protein
MAVVNIPNEVANQIILYGIETVPGTPVTPDARLLGTIETSENAPLSRQEESTGGYDRLITPKRGPSTFSGTYSESLTFESLPQLMRLGLKGGGATGAGNATDGYTYTQEPTFNVDDIDSATFQYNVPGLGFQTTGATFNEWTIAIDAENQEGAWQFSSNLFLRSRSRLPGSFDGTVASATGTTVTVTGAGWTANQFQGAYLFMDSASPIGPVRQIASNTTDTLTVSAPFDPVPTAGTPFHIAGLFAAGVPLPEYEAIETYGTKVYLDQPEAIGTTDIAPTRLISANITHQINRTGKRFVGNGRNELSARTGRGARVVSGQLRVEFDRPYELQRLEALDDLALRFEQVGSVLDEGTGARKRARIDIPRVVLDTVAQDTRENNITATFAFVAYLSSTDPIISVETVNRLATLP